MRFLPILFQRDMFKDVSRGQYQPVTLRHSTVTARVGCPLCGIVAILSRDYSISTVEGLVQPSFECLVCGFNEFIQLKGWVEVAA